MLILTLQKKWFDMILSGEKQEEYREIKPYYTSRFCNVVLHNGGHFEKIGKEDLPLAWYRKIQKWLCCKCTIFFGGLCLDDRDRKGRMGCRNGQIILCFENCKCEKRIGGICYEAILYKTEEKNSF